MGAGARALRVCVAIAQPMQGTHPARFSILVVAGLLLSACGPQPPVLQEIRFTTAAVSVAPTLSPAPVSG